MLGMGGSYNKKPAMRALDTTTLLSGLGGAHLDWLSREWITLIIQEPVNAPFLNGLFSMGFSRGKTAHQGIRGNGPSRSENGPLTNKERKRPINYFASSPETFCEYFFRSCLGILHWKMAGIFGEFVLVSVSHETKHGNSSKIRGKFGEKFGAK